MHYKITYRNSMSEMAVDYIEAEDSKPLALVKALTKWQTSTVKSGKTDRSRGYLMDEIEMISEAYPAIEENEALYRAMRQIYEYQMRTVFGLRAFSSAEEMLFDGQPKEVEEFLRAYIKAWESFDEAFVWEFVKKTLDEGGHA